MINNDEYFQSRPKGTEKELKALALDTIELFFEAYDLDESQDLLWQILKQSFVNPFSTLDVKERANLISFYENLHRVILAASILHNGRISQDVWNS
ncbi:MAG: hypothetical protein P0Y49_21955 [Candidatus Pedobacter colombiensis]|uniref:Uncharacterized protein n=1 Tax=Candidatus Pedobacter colombiensis TaxID=3121371 RepID=A0AAJ6B628_9SPHI|nr:hypothetical protein [Pedobacter sp.]WEK19442.1 MAG: hypothetical protein P0Y49_21955 [Pedobacter sp.]